MLVEGLCRYGLHTQAAKVARALFDAADNFQRRRLPEVFAGLTREPGSFPAQYLGANVPQGWAAGAPPQMLVALLGIEPALAAPTLEVRAHLPEWLPYVRVERLRVGRTSFALSIARTTRGDVEVRFDNELHMRTDFVTDSRVTDGRRQREDSV
jgi:glycogen debranching enzyme